MYKHYVMLIREVLYMIDAKKSDQSEITLNYGMVGGSEGSFIGDVHRKAAAFDGKCKLVAGCFFQELSTKQ